MSSRLEPLKPGGKYAKAYAYAYLTLLVVLLVGIPAAAVHLGYVAADLTITATIDMGLPIQLLATGIAAAIVLWTFIQIVRVTGSRFINSVMQALAVAMDGFDYDKYLEQRERRRNE